MVIDSEAGSGPSVQRYRSRPGFLSWSTSAASVVKKTLRPSGAAASTLTLVGSLGSEPSGSEIQTVRSLSIRWYS